MAEHERLYQQQFATIGQLLDYLRNSFGIMGNISNSYIELGQLCMRNWEDIIDYIDRVQTMYSNIIEAQKTLREPLRPNVDIARINERYVHSFYSVLSSDIRTLREGNDLPPAKMYEMIEKANPEIEVKYRAQRAYPFHADFHTTILESLSEE